MSANRIKRKETLITLEIIHNKVNIFQNFILYKIGINSNIAKTLNRMLVNRRLSTNKFWLNQYIRNKLNPHTKNKTRAKFFLIQVYQNGNESNMDITRVIRNDPFISIIPNNDKALV
jgi:hypothetical protein